MSATASKAVSNTVSPLRPLGTLIDSLSKLRDKKRTAEEVVKGISTEMSALEEQIFERMAQEGTTSASGKSASASITENVVANVKDWDSFHEYVRKHKFFHLLHRRVSDAACRELFQMGKTIPGVEPFTKKSLNLRSK